LYSLRWQAALIRTAIPPLYLPTLTSALASQKVWQARIRVVPQFLTRVADENEDEEEMHQPTPTSIRSHEGGRSNIIHRQPRSLSNCVTMADVSSIEKSSPWDNAYDKFEATDGKFKAGKARLCVTKT